MYFANSETLWAEHGLTGLVLCALFGLIIMFIKVLGTKDKIITETLTKKDSMITNILAEERKERKSESEANRASQSRLSDAIDGLAKELRDDRKTNHDN